MKHFRVLLPLCFAIAALSCSEKIEEALETDYVVIELDYGIFNHVNNRSNPPDIIIKERNFVSIEVDENGMCIIDGKTVADSLIVSELKSYLIPNPDDEKRPKTTLREFTHAGKVIVNENLLISGKFPKDLDYQRYREIRNMLYYARNEARDEFSRKLFRKTVLELLEFTDPDDREKWIEIRQIVPFRYSEVLPK